MEHAMEVKSGLYHVPISASTPRYESSDDSGYSSINQSSSRAFKKPHLLSPQDLPQPPIFDLSNEHWFDSSHEHTQCPISLTISSFLDCCSEVSETNRIDFLKELSRYHHIRTKILNYLSDADLVSVCSVSRTWRESCKTDRRASERWESYLREKRELRDSVGKENWGHNRASKQSSGAGAMCLISSNKITEVKNPSSPVKSRHQTFVEEGKQLSKDEHLKPCPRCNYPSKVLPEISEASCLSKSCFYRYCTRCLVEITVEKHKCSTPRHTGRNQVIGSAASRKQLKRL